MMDNDFNNLSFFIKSQLTDYQSDRNNQESRIDEIVI
jgi:hypothetical protein